MQTLLRFVKPIGLCVLFFLWGSLVIVFGQPNISQLTTVDAKTVRIQLAGNPADVIELLYRQPNGSYVASPTKYRNGEIFTFQTDTSVPQCFRVQLVGATNTASPETVCTLVLSGTALSQQNKLSWQPYTGSPATLQWSMTKNGNPITVPGSSVPATRNMTDRDGIRCKPSYCYTLQATTGLTTITSNSVCLTFDNATELEPVISVLATVEKDSYIRYQVNGRIVDMGGLKVKVSRSDRPEGPFVPIGTADQTNAYYDRSINPANQSYCYQSVMENECGATTPLTPVVCTVWLTSKSRGALDWSAEVPAMIGTVAIYIVIIVDKKTGAIIRSVPVGTETHYEPDQSDPDYANYRYFIQAHGTNGISTYSNTFEIALSPLIYAPTAFTPNGDGQNDRFQAKGSLPKDYRLTVFDRWGEVIFSTTSREESDGWDGTIQNQPAPKGTYPWRIDLRDETGLTNVKTGMVTLL